MCNHKTMKTKQVTNFEAYRIREDGVLETNWRTGAHYPGMPCDDRWRELPNRFNAKGYIPVCLRGHGIKQRRTHIHRLMAEEFIGPPPFTMACVRHLDGNARNNSIENLAWGTYQENEDDKLRHGTHAKRISNGKLTENTMKIVRAMKTEGGTTNAIADVVGVSRPTISRFLNGRTWK
jgi:hypothetical protein